MAYNVSSVWTVAAEEYADFGPIRGFLPARQQAHQVYGVVDYNGRPMGVEAGIGVGITDGADKLTLKLILTRDLKKF